ncbi:MAG: DUF1799 domain-containing protein [Burkholderiaceae bacterium]
MGASPERVAAWRKALMARAHFVHAEVWPEHWHAWQVFCAMSTQWRAVAGRARTVWLGLDYTPMRTVERCLRPAIAPHLRRDWPALLEQLQVLEVAAIKARNAN